MKKILVFLFVAFCGTPIWGQINVSQGEWVKQETKGTHQGFVMTDSNFLYSIDYYNNNFRNEQKLIAKVYDKKKLIPHNSFDIAPEKKSGREIDLVQIFSVQQSMVLVMVENSKSDSFQKRILLQLIHPDGTREEPVIADTLPSQQNVNEDFQVIVDKEEKGFIICINYPVSIEYNQKLKITAFNSDLSQKWRKTVTFPNKEKQFIFTDWRYDGGNKVFFLSRHIIDMYQADMEFASIDQNKYFLWGYDNQADKLKEIELSLNKRFIHKITIEQDENRWVVAGIYANDKYFHSDGVFNLLLDSTWNVVSHTIHNLTVEENQNYAQYSDPKSTRKGIDDIQIKNIVPMKNGEFAVIGEEFYKEIEDPIDGRMSTSNFTEVLHYQNISIFWFEKSGEFKGLYCIPKNQISTNDNGTYSSYAMATNNEEVFLFFNDHPKNMSPDKSYGMNPKPLSEFRKMYLKCVQINSKGILKANPVTSSSRKARIRPKNGSQLLDQSTYFLIQKGKKNSAVKVVIP